MTDRDIEKYCVEQSLKYTIKAGNASTRNEERYYAGQANAFMWIAAVIRQNREVKPAH